MTEETANFPKHTREDTYGVKEFIIESFTAGSILSVARNNEGNPLREDTGLRFVVKFRGTWSAEVTCDVTLSQTVFQGNCDGYYEPCMIVRASRSTWKKEHIFTYLLREYPEVAKRIAQIILVLLYQDKIGAFLHTHEIAYLIGEIMECSCEECKKAKVVT